MGSGDGAAGTDWRRAESGLAAHDRRKTVFDAGRHAFTDISHSRTAVRAERSGSESPAAGKSPAADKKRAGERRRRRGCASGGAAPAAGPRAFGSVSPVDEVAAISAF